MKKIGVLGTGVVGNTIAKKLVELGYDVMMGSRSKGNEKALAFVESTGGKAKEGTFADVARFGEVIFNCTKGEVTLQALQLAGLENLSGKTVVDLSNPLDFSKGMPPSLLPAVSNTNSLGEEVQKLLSTAHVVKTLNIVNCQVMVNAKQIGGDATMLLCGNDAGAKADVAAILNQFGWDDVIDLGGISAARGMEMLVPGWVGIMQALKTANFGFKVVRKQA